MTKERKTLCCLIPASDYFVRRYFFSSWGRFQVKAAASCTRLLTAGRGRRSKTDSCHRAQSRQRSSSHSQEANLIAPLIAVDCCGMMMSSVFCLLFSLSHTLCCCITDILRQRKARPGVFKVQTSCEGFTFISRTNNHTFPLLHNETHHCQNIPLIFSTALWKCLL